MNNALITPISQQDTYVFCGLSDDLKPGYTIVQSAVRRINEKLKLQGSKHKTVISESKAAIVINPTKLCLSCTWEVHHGSNRSYGGRIR